MSDEDAPPGRPSGYSPELGTEICQRLSEGQSLRAVCRDPAMPSMSMVMRWVAANGKFREQYTRAREDLLEHWAEDIIEISDESSGDYVPTEVGDGVVGERVDHEHISRSKLRVDSRKWLLSKLAPKKYGERVSAELSGPDGAPIETRNRVDVSGLSDEQLRALASIAVQSR